ncbi:uncharacterized protein CYBJADRAFT_13108 [Cyberlindnera jadinii NRRL Y-1542]|uniref:Uncharacterized protein n=1 Tax=Cyberlindnera jadinii (strain ATCC 18201 / CBS 1600 / BCRC 20928 / JCM 3617 / NBRC 0987 / NRRL Y-1542) TaxID=983966 RepID=A0A1E4SAH1_CYBJN|nr:hypothetical protein CYBJADRAFT_13108 [Cyberlindnera jadinii NRRL Y-1542]ODV76465.1 hypothetical protein CYBJADRAFT_13108 [Cyberlindnera jadinii NRRL Y-1542]
MTLSMKLESSTCHLTWPLSFSLLTLSMLITPCISVVITHLRSKAVVRNRPRFSHSVCNPNVARTGQLA